MQKGFLVAALLTGFAIPPAYAEDFTVAQMWERFGNTCAQALDDPDAFLSGIDAPGPSGERVISTSPDTKVVSVYRREANLYDEVQLHLIGSREVRDCSVTGEFYDRDTAALADELLAIAASQESIAISGGHAPQDYDEDGIYTVDDIYLYAIDGLFPEARLITVAHVIGGEVQLYVQQTVD